MVQIFSTLAFLLVAAGGIGVIAAMIGDNREAIRAALSGTSGAALRADELRIRVRTRRSAYRVAAHLPAARRAA